jgi:hypothetical protein
MSSEEEESEEETSVIESFKEVKKTQEENKPMFQVSHCRLFFTTWTFYKPALAFIQFVL